MCTPAYLSGVEKALSGASYEKVQQVLYNRPDPFTKPIVTLLIEIILKSVLIVHCLHIVRFPLQYSNVNVPR